MGSVFQNSEVVNTKPDLFVKVVEISVTNLSTLEFETRLVRSGHFNAESLFIKTK